MPDHSDLHRVPLSHRFAQLSMEETGKETHWKGAPIVPIRRLRLSWDIVQGKALRNSLAPQKTGEKEGQERRAETE